MVKKQRSSSMWLGTPIFINIISSYMCLLVVYVLNTPPTTKVIHMVVS